MNIAIFGNGKMGQEISSLAKSRGHIVSCISSSKNPTIKLNLKNVDSKKFPSIKIIERLQNKSSLLDTIIVLSNDELVNLFLLKKINFNDIMKILLKLINMKEFRKYNNKKPGSIKNIIYLDKYIRKKINKIIN